jgi:poly(A) polymerase
MAAGKKESQSKKEAIGIVLKLRESGHRAYIVGGAVRDMVMGREPEDYDIATDASPAEVERLFDRVYGVGAKFGVSLVAVGDRTYEVAMFRRDAAYEDGRRPSKVESADEEGDVRRRDFTMNALLYDPVEDRVIDHVGGVEDIRLGVVRTVGDPSERFAEDRLRMLRAVRFAARLGFEIDGAAMDAVRQLAPLVMTVSAERIGEELAKTFTGPNPGRALTLLDGSGLLAVVLPEVAALKGVEQSPEHHPEGDAFTHTRIMLDLLDDGSPALAFAALLHDIGKPVALKKKGRNRFPLHDAIGADMAADILMRFRFDRATVARVRTLVLKHMRFMNVPGMKRSTLRRFIAEPEFEELLELHRLDTASRCGDLSIYRFLLGELQRERKEQATVKLPEPLLDGGDLIAMGYTPGPEFRTMLDAVMDAQLEGSIGTKSEAESFAKRRFPNRPSRITRGRRRRSPD